jgi:hypothetical protein
LSEGCGKWQKSGVLEIIIYYTVYRLYKEKEQSMMEKFCKRYEGKYYIRTSRRDLSEKELWELYMTIIGIEEDTLYQINVGIFEIENTT